LKQTLIVPGSGFYSSGMFLFFLEEEFLRFNDHHRPFSLVMISLKRDRAEPINPADLIQRMRGLGTILRASDRFCHFQNSSFGIVLPETTEVEAKAIVRNIVNQLTKITPENVGSRGTFWMKIGSASVPVDCDSVGNLVALALKQDHSSVFMLK
jgi:GGDEF domain-containing protein